MNVRVLVVALLLSVVVMHGAAADDTRRLALVIGNGDYTSSPLANPANDARDMAEALRAVGFEVHDHVDLDRRGMREAIRDFGRALRDGGIGLFYYAGHGIQVNGVNYLIPVGADIHEEFEVPDEGVAADVVLRAMERADNPFNIVILDSCRDNPFARSFRSSQTGLARMNAPSGTVIAYATAPGRVAADGDGDNGLYTAHLLEQMHRPGLSLEQVFKRVRAEVEKETNGRQVPWEESSLTGDFYFVTGEGSTVQVNVGTATASAGPGQALWNEVRDSEDPVELNAYLERFPDGTYATLAAARIESLESRRELNALTVSIEGPEVIPVGEKVFFTIRSDNAVRAEWSIGGFTNGRVAVDPMVDGHQIFIEPTDRRRVGDRFTLVFTVFDDQGRSEKVRRTFRIGN